MSRRGNSLTADTLSGTLRHAAEQTQRLQTGKKDSYSDWNGLVSQFCWYIVSVCGCRMGRTLVVTKGVSYMWCQFCYWSVTFRQHFGLFQLCICYHVYLTFSSSWLVFLATCTLALAAISWQVLCLCRTVASTGRWARNWWRNNRTKNNNPISWRIGQWQYNSTTYQTLKITFTI